MKTRTTAFTYIATFFMLAIFWCLFGIFTGFISVQEMAPETSYLHMMVFAALILAAGMYMAVFGARTRRQYLRCNGEKLLIGGLILWSFAGLWSL